jgi:CSLREA domain-containing protein
MRLRDRRWNTKSGGCRTWWRRPILPNLGLPFRLATVLIIFCSPAAEVGAAEIQVTTSADQFGVLPECSLREAVESANIDEPFGGCPAGNGHDTILLPQGILVFQLTEDDETNANGDLVVTDDLHIVGADPVGTTLYGALKTRILRVAPGTVVDATRVKFRKGKARKGGAILNEGELHLFSCVVENNQGPNGTSKASPDGGDGGGIYNTGELYLVDTKVRYNKAGNAYSYYPSSPGIGGGIRSTGKLVLDGCEVTDNTAGSGGYWFGGSGGGIIAAGELMVIDSVISNNSAGNGPNQWCEEGAHGGGGGGVQCSGTCRFLDSVVTGNSTGDGGNGGGPCGCDCLAGMRGGNGGNGGGIRAVGDLEIIRSTVSGNTTGSGGNGGSGSPVGKGGNGGLGGGVYVDGTGLVIDSVLEGNETGNGGYGNSAGAGGKGGGISSKGTLVVLRTRVNDNSTGAGGYCSPSGCDGNGGYGGGIGSSPVSNTTTSMTVIVGSTIRGNSTGPSGLCTGSCYDAQRNGGGGGIASYGDLDLVRSAVVENTATGNGGGIHHYSKGKSARITNSTIGENVAKGGGGGIYLAGTQESSLSSCTVALNSSGTLWLPPSPSGGALYLEDGAALQTRNSVLALNTDKWSPLLQCVHSQTSESLGNNLSGADSGCFTPATADVEVADPLVEPLSSPWEKAPPSYCPMSLSPVIDAGTCLAANGQTLSEDQIGAKRPAPGADTCDIGAREYSPDYDGDGLEDSLDPCPGDDSDDADGDGLCGGSEWPPAAMPTGDNCPDHTNPEQEDQDNDGLGDLCDPCPDNGFNDLDMDGYCAGTMFNPPMLGAGDCFDLPLACGAACNPGLTDECDEYDNDCDGVANEDYVPDKSCGIGYCHLNNKPSKCYSSGYTVKCKPGKPLSAFDETCDGVDDDCDGLIDEDLPDGTCDDGDACTIGDACIDGNCLSLPLDCNDDNPCTDDGCDPTTGCVFENNDILCDDGDACTENDLCSQGNCAGTTATCNDNNLCTDDGCDPATGCVFQNNDILCDDGDACTENDLCSQGTCAGTILTCNDNNLCTDDGCDPANGCNHIANQAACDDGDMCTKGESCFAGECLSGPTEDDCCNVDGDCEVPFFACETQEHLCVSVLCQSCQRASDCHYPGNSCLSYPSGSYCGAACSPGADECPVGFDCRMLPGFGYQCMGTKGDCVCQELFSSLCHHSDLHWVDSCGELGTVKKACGARGCANGGCCPEGTHEEVNECVTAGPMVEPDAVDASDVADTPPNSDSAQPTVAELELTTQQIARLDAEVKASRAESETHNSDGGCGLSARASPLTLLAVPFLLVMLLAFRTFVRRRCKRLLGKRCSSRCSLA